MLLAVDVGNTNTKLGLYDETRLVRSWRVTSRREQTADEYGVITRALLAGIGLAPAVVTGVAISSTVPAVQRALEEMVRLAFGVLPLVVEPGLDGPVPMRVDYPREVGPDRVVKIVAGVELYGAPLIIVDLGTATTFECVSVRGEFIGGADGHRDQHGHQHSVRDDLRVRRLGRWPRRTHEARDGGRSPGGGHGGTGGPDPGHFADHRGGESPPDPRRPPHPPRASGARTLRRASGLTGGEGGSYTSQHLVGERPVTPKR